MLKAREIERLSGKPRLKVWLIALLSGPLLTVSQPPVDLPYVGLIALAPLLLAVPRLSAGGAWLAGFLCGLSYFWLNMWWLGQMVTDPGNEWIVFAMFAFVATAMSCYWGVAVMMIRWLLTRQAMWLGLLAPFAWLAFEFIHEFNTPAPYPWLPIGMSLADFTLLAQTADIWGHYGLTLLCVLVSLAVAAPFMLAGDMAAFKQRPGKVRFALPVCVALLLAACLGYGAMRIAQFEAAEVTDGPKIGLVQGHLAQEVKVRNDPNRLPKSFDEHLELTRQCIAQEAELVCWAETMLFGGTTREGLLRGASPKATQGLFHDGVPDQRLLDSRWYAGRLRAHIAWEFATPMLVGAITTVPEEEQIHTWKNYEYRAYNTAMLFDAKGRVSASYDKRYLVPGGEYIPREDFEIFGWTPIRDVVEHYAEGLQGSVSRVEPGLRTTLFRLPSKAERLGGREWAFTSSICYEYVWPGCYVELHEAPDRYPDFHINISNEGWFLHSAELDQAVDSCRIRAIESRVPMVRATNTGVTCNIDANGRVRETLIINGSDREQKGIMVAKPFVLAEPRPTLFVSMVKRSPGWISLIAAGCILPLMIAGRVQHRTRRLVQLEPELATRLKARGHWAFLLLPVLGRRLAGLLARKPAGNAGKENKG